MDNAKEKLKNKPSLISQPPNYRTINRTGDPVLVEFNEIPHVETADPITAHHSVPPKRKTLPATLSSPKNLFNLIKNIGVRDNFLLKRAR